MSTLSVFLHRSTTPMAVPAAGPFTLPTMQTSTTADGERMFYDIFPLRVPSDWRDQNGNTGTLESEAAKALLGHQLDDIKQTILLYAGRQAAAAYMIASGSAAENRRPYVQHALLYEPFTYWDWHELTWEEWDQQDDYRKRRLLWERERGYRAKEHWYGYPCGKKRWIAFKKKINNTNRHFVKQMAVSHWMTLEDLSWITTELPALEGLDLSDIRYGQEWLGGKHPGPSDWGLIRSALCDSSDRSAVTFDEQDVKRLTCLDGTEKEQTIAELQALYTDVEQSHTLQPNGNSTAHKRVWYALRTLRILSRRLLSRQSAYDREYKTKKADRPVYKHCPSLYTKTTKAEVLWNLKWLGVPDWRGPNHRNTAMDTILPMCLQLKTLSIRGRYEQDVDLSSLENPHEFVCGSISGITAHLSDTVESIELRHSLQFPGLFLEELFRRLARPIRIGIDLGACIQVYPFRKEERPRSDRPPRDASKSKLTLSRVQSNSLAAARKARFDAYERAHESHVNEDARWFLPRSSAATVIPIVENDGELNTQEKQKTQEEDEDTQYKARQYSFYRNRGGSRISHRKVTGAAPSKINLMQCPIEESPHHCSYVKALEDEEVNTLGRFFKRLYAARRVETPFFPLEPDPQNRSADPIHPFALVQLEDGAGVQSGRTFDKNSPVFDGDLPEVYKWLHQTFNWRPVFDWDDFMLVNRTIATETGDDVDPAYAAIFETDPESFSRIESHFQLLKDAGIPLHILIGRRLKGTSSCYWHWQDDSEHRHKRDKWAERSYDVKLDNVAHMVDTLSIFYDLRNPLDKVRLEEIDEIEPIIQPLAKCPRVKCPWKRDHESGAYEPEECPFFVQRKSQQEQRFEYSQGSEPQKMANKHYLQPKKPSNFQSYAHLANACEGAPAPGENAMDHPSDDSDTGDMPPPVDTRTFHQLSRRAMFTREALHWQKFWSQYALKFTNLTMLRVRMPRCFDVIGSWRLAKLLNQKLGWEILTYTDERMHVQTPQDLERTVGLTDQFEHQREAKVWPAGRFVRRTWIWPQKRTKFIEQLQVKHGPKTVLVESDTSREWGERTFTAADEKETDKNEQFEFEKALLRAKVAENRIREFENLPSVKAIRELLKANKLQQKLAERQQLREAGQRQWEHQLELYIGELEEHMQQRVFEAAQSPASVHATEQKELEQSILQDTVESLRQLAASEALIFRRPRLPTPSEKQEVDEHGQSHEYYEAVNEDEPHDILPWTEFEHAARLCEAREEERRQDGEDIDWDLVDDLRLRRELEAGGDQVVMEDLPVLDELQEGLYGAHAVAAQQSDFAEGGQALLLPFLGMPRDEAVVSDAGPTQDSITSLVPAPVPTATTRKRSLEDGGEVSVAKRPKSVEADVIHFMDEIKTMSSGLHILGLTHTESASNFQSQRKPSEGKTESAAKAAKAAEEPQQMPPSPSLGPMQRPPHVRNHTPWNMASVSEREVTDIEPTPAVDMSKLVKKTKRKRKSPESASTSVRKDALPVALEALQPPTVEPGVEPGVEPAAKNRRVHQKAEDAKYVDEPALDDEEDEDELASDVSQKEEGKGKGKRGGKIEAQRQYEYAEGDAEEEKPKTKVGKAAQAKGTTSAKASRGTRVKKQADTEAVELDEDTPAAAEPQRKTKGKKIAYVVKEEAEFKVAPVKKGRGKKKAEPEPKVAKVAEVAEGEAEPKTKGRGKQRTVVEPVKSPVAKRTRSKLRL